MKLKRENWKGSYIMVARERGRIKSWRKWSPSSFTKKQAKIKFNQDKTFTENVHKEILTNVTEVSDYRKNSRRTERCQYFVEIRFSDGTKVSARSLMYSSDYPKKEMKQEAWDNVLGLVSWNYYGASDTSLGIELLNQKRHTIREGFVYYV